MGSPSLVPHTPEARPQTTQAVSISVSLSQLGNPRSSWQPRGPLWATLGHCSFLSTGHSHMAARLGRAGTAILFTCVWEPELGPLHARHYWAQGRGLSVPTVLWVGLGRHGQQAAQPRWALPENTWRLGSSHSTRNFLGTLSLHPVPVPPCEQLRAQPQPTLTRALDWCETWHTALSVCLPCF